MEQAEVDEMWENFERMVIIIKLECLQSSIMIGEKLVELLLGLIFPTAKNTAFCSGRNLTKLWEDGNYYETEMFTRLYYDRCKTEWAITWYNISDRKKYSLPQWTKCDEAFGGHYVILN